MLWFKELIKWLQIVTNYLLEKAVLKSAPLSNVVEAVMGEGRMFKFKTNYSTVLKPVLTHKSSQGCQESTKDLSCLG